MSKDWIRTHTGRRFYPLAPRIEDFCIEDVAHALSNQCRYAGHTPELYSVAQHSVHVQEYLAQIGAGLEIQFAGLMHDAPEAYLQDMPTPIKRAMPAYREAEDRVDVLLREFFGVATGPDIDETVKIADMGVFAMEVRDLMGNPQDWDSTKGCRPQTWEIIPWQPIVARTRFMARYEELRGKLLRERSEHARQVHCV